MAAIHIEYTLENAETELEGRDFDSTDPEIDRLKAAHRRAWRDLPAIEEHGAWFSFVGAMNLTHKSDPHGPRGADREQAIQDYKTRQWGIAAAQLCIMQDEGLLPTGDLNVFLGLNDSITIVSPGHEPIRIKKEWDAHKRCNVYRRIGA